MRGLILGIAVACYAAALAIVGAGMRVPVPGPGLPVAAAPVAVPAISTPSPHSLLPQQPTPQEPPSAPPPQLPAEPRQTTVEDLAREQAASHQVVNELRATVARLQEQIAHQGATPHDSEPHGRTVAVLCCGLLPPGQETLAPGVEAAVRSALPEIKADDRQIVSVEGHTDGRPVRTPAGKPFKDNADLSLLRARAVAALLRKQGVAASRIRVKGWGDTRPLDTNETAEGRDRNRRVEIRLLSPSPEP